MLGTINVSFKLKECLFACKKNTFRMYVYMCVCVYTILKYFSYRLVAQTVQNIPAMWRPGYIPWVGMIPLGRGWQPLPVFFPGESPWTESDTTEQLRIYI